MFGLVAGSSDSYPAHSGNGRHSLVWPYSRRDRRVSFYFSAYPIWTGKLGHRFCAIWAEINSSILTVTLLCHQHTELPTSLWIIMSGCKLVKWKKRICTRLQLSCNGDERVKLCMSEPLATPSFQTTLEIKQRQSYKRVSKLMFYAQSASVVVSGRSYWRWWSLVLGSLT